MTLSDLISEFNVVINTSEGLKELRSLILGLAVRGKLVEQNPNDEPVSELLKKIEAEKKRLYEEGEIGKPKKHKEISINQIPFNIPDNWVWACLSQTSITINGDRGKNYPSIKDTVESGIPFINAGNLVNGSISDLNMRYITEERFNLLRSGKVEFGDILYCLRGSLGKMGIVKTIEKGAIASSLIIIRTLQNFNISYLFYLLASPHGSYLINKYDNGTAQPNLAAGSLRDFEIPLPPLAEQYRIVKKIEALFAEVDELEEKLNRQTKLDKKLQKAVNAEVQQAPDTEASKSAWNFITSNFETLYHSPEAIDNLKKNILNEAVRGRLVPQNPNDEPASELLKKIEAEKERLYEEGEIRKPKKLPPVKEDEIPFKIPKSWEWCRFGSVIELVSGQHIKSADYNEDGIGVPYLTGPTDFGEKYPKIAKWTDKPKVNAIKEDILLTVKGSGVGKINFVDIGEICISRQLMAIRPIQISNELSYYFLKSRKQAIHELSVGIAIPGISREDVTDLYFALPPLEEQHRIVQRIEELFAICDQFKAQLQQHQKVNEKLVKGLVGEVLEKATSEEKNKEPKHARILPFKSSREVKYECVGSKGINRKKIQAGIMAMIIIDHDQNKKYKKLLGHVKMEKTLHEVEAITKIDLGRTPKRIAAGPADFPWLKLVEHMAHNMGWFHTYQREDGSYYYNQGTNIDSAVRLIYQNYGSHLKEIKRIIKLFLPFTTEQAEVVATTYAAWHDLITYGYDPTDEEIVIHASTKEFWTIEKEDLPRKNFYKSIEWLKRNSLIPDGKGKLTKANIQ